MLFLERNIVLIFLFLQRYVLTNAVLREKHSDEVFVFTEIRSDERKVLEKAAIVQGLSTSSAPMVPIMASVFVIVAHVLTGNDLTAAQV